MKKRFDAVKMVRAVRDKLHAKTQRMSSKELIEFYHQASAQFHSQKSRSKAVTH